MPSVKIRQDEPFDVILRRFRRACEKPACLLNHADGSITKNLPPCVNAPEQLLSSAKRSASVARIPEETASTERDSAALPLRSVPPCR